MYVAVSGVSRTLTRAQAAGVREELAARLGPGDTLVTGGAYGVDTCAALWAISEGVPVFIYAPSELLWNRGLATVQGIEVAEVPGTYMDRNDAIADSSAERVVAFPLSGREIRSGTMATVRRFQARGKEVVVIPIGKFK